MCVCVIYVTSSPRARARCGVHGRIAVAPNRVPTLGPPARSNAEKYSRSGVNKWLLKVKV